MQIKKAVLKTGRLLAAVPPGLTQKGSLCSGAYSRFPITRDDGQTYLVSVRNSGVYLGRRNYQVAAPLALCKLQIDLLLPFLVFNELVS